MGGFCIDQSTRYSVHTLFFKQALVLLLGCISWQAQAQHTYMFPVNPGKKSWLTGNFGEIRSSHFHAGLDIAANPGTPVRAVANGYVYRLKASTYGYGNAVYLYHPHTKQQSLYGHLLRFAPKIARYVRARQNQQQDFFYEEYLKAHAIPVAKGEIIAYVGNTGASAGPHLHFEIRTLADEALNPFQFKFKEIGYDNIPPVIRALAIKTLNINGRVNNRFGRYQFKVRKVARNRYTLGKVITANGKIGFELLTHDLMNRASNTYGTTKIKVVVDGRQVFLMDINKIDHHINKAMRVHADYAQHRRSYRGYQRCYVADGNPYTFYQTDALRGAVNIQDNRLHSVAIYATDFWGNTSILSFKIKGKLPPMVKFRPTSVPRRTYLSYEIQGNTLVLKGHYIRQKADIARFNVAGLAYDVPIVYMQGLTSVYLWDLRHGLPDYVELGSLRKKFNLRMLVPANRTVIYREAGRLEIKFPKGALFDTLYLETKLYKNSVTINSSYTPIFKNIEISLKPAVVPTNKKGWNVYQGNKFIKGSRWVGNKMVFQYDRLGNYRIARDISPPSLRWLRKSLYKISFRIKDNLSGIKNFKATLNGKFLLMNYEHKGFMIWSAAPLGNKRKALKGLFTLTITDKAGNVRYFKARL
ncbi:M23 family metallopeptidase [Microscilla marina]|uniref:M23 peptidase domain protein n=1 Tax=Microscilla marina ATCC 23134 TaxID=313606 RepID=A1ZT85_MICM2|nr:M23 family metallopeptidase [Microscilla marina]EAY26475.1 M23 peptidase domain protein [Microscilla marina ATCC 23134]